LACKAQFYSTDTKLVAARLAAELVLEYRYVLRILGMKVEGPTTVFGDNNSVILNTSVPSSMLKKKHNACAYRRVQEAHTSRILQMVHLPSVENYANVLAKPLPGIVFHQLVRPLLFGRSGYKKDPTLPRSSDDVQAMPPCLTDARAPGPPPATTNTLSL
jgi:hypothetical protein